jgi:hypothetical protein
VVPEEDMAILTGRRELLPIKTAKPQHHHRHCSLPAATKTAKTSTTTTTSSSLQEP